jgi:nucleoside-diphosphate-sugar epimerase
MRVNIEGTRNLLRNIDEEVVFILASSISTYGITSSESLPLLEEHPQKGHNNYSTSKIEAEQLVIASGVPYVILRVAPIAVADLLELPDVVPYRADQRVEFIDVEDAAYAFYQASRRPEANMKTLNVAGGISWQMTGSEFINGFYGALGLEVEPNYSEDYTAVDWYDTSKSRFLGYQKTNFNDFQRKLGSVAEELGLI